MVIFISNGSYGNVQPKHVILVSVQKAYFQLRVCKLPGFMHQRIGPTMKFAEIQVYHLTWYRVCTKVIFISKGSYGNEEPKNVILISVEKAYIPLRGCKLPGFTHRRIGPTMKFAEIGGYLSTWYRVCTKAIFTSKGSYGNVEPKNAILVLVQKAYFPLRGCKLPGFTHRRIGPTMKFAEIGGYLSTWYRVCNMEIFISKQSYRNAEPKHVIFVSVQKAYFPLRGCKEYGFKHHRIRRTMKFAEIRNYLSTWYRVCTKVIFISKGSYGNAEPENIILVSVQKAYFPLRGCKLPGFMHCRIQPTMQFAEIRGYISAWYRVFTKGSQQKNRRCSDSKSVLLELSIYLRYIKTGL